MDTLVAKKYSSVDNLTTLFKDTLSTPLKKTLNCSVSVTDVLRLKTNIEADALQAVKLDPAVLEAQVTVDGAPRPAAAVPALSRATSVAGASSCSGKGSSSSSASMSSSSSTDMFRHMQSLQHEALRSISPEQLALLLRYVATLRRQRKAAQRNLECAFCKNNGESPPWYSSHGLKDWRGRVLCPVLRAFHCPRCGATGDRAHTIKYCPEMKIVTVGSSAFDIRHLK
ncbi:hypothetical protein JYU34_006118 [Plutella xylostella]|uniref:Nanos-type domain-containing protein n=1 Tax=Plutella xylostella TaxID=51655 RepID=A0ABQ7QUY8_PLUXY|nr:hypothetical protein JYU34_006118 [Plutella xylostella]